MSRYEVVVEGAPYLAMTATRPDAVEASRAEASSPPLLSGSARRWSADREGAAS